MKKLLLVATALMAVTGSAYAQTHKLNPNTLYQQGMTTDTIPTQTQVTANAAAAAAAMTAANAALPKTGGAIGANLTGSTTQANLAITTTANGSGTNGPITAKNGLYINAQKNNWFNYPPSATVGEVDPLQILGRQGTASGCTPTTLAFCSDMSGALIDVQNTGLGFLSATEMASNEVDNNPASPTFNTLIHGIDIQEGIINALTGDYIGANYEAIHGSETTALQIENGGAGTSWSNILKNIVNGSTNFLIDASGNITSATGTLNMGGVTTPNAQITGGSVNGVTLGTGVNFPSVVSLSSIVAPAGVATATVTTAGCYTIVGGGSNFMVPVIPAPPSGGTQAVAAVTSVSAVCLASGNNLVNAGSGYSVNDILTISGGTFSTASRIKVLTIGAGGSIASYSANVAGVYTVLPSEPVSVTGGTGTGAQLQNLGYSPQALSITTPGTGYLSPPPVSFTTQTGVVHTTGTAAGTTTLTPGGAISVAPAGVAISGAVTASALPSTHLLGTNSSGTLQAASSADVTAALGYSPVNPTAAAITAGTINGATVGATTPAAGSFTSVNVTSGSASITAGSTVSAGQMTTQTLTTGRNASVVNITTPSAATKLFTSTGGMTGTASTQGALNLITVSSDNAACGSSECNALNISHNFGGPAMTGPRNSLQTVSIFNTASGNVSDTTAEYVAENSQMFVNSPDNGTAPTPGNSQGEFFAANPEIIVGAGAQNLSQVFGEEIDVNTNAASTYGGAIGLLIQNRANAHGVNGGDSGIALSANLGSSGWDYGLNLGNTENHWTIASTGAIIGGTRQPSMDLIRPTGEHVTPPIAAHGIDFSTMHLTSDAFSSEGVILSNSKAQVGNATLASTATGAALDVPLLSSTGATVANGGSTPSTNPSYVGDILWASCGGEYQVATVSAGSVLTVTQLTPCTAASAPANPISVTGGSGAGITLTLTWPTTRALTLNPTGVTVLSPFTSGVGTPTTANIPTGMCMDWVNTSTSTPHRYCNVAGTIDQE